MLQIEQTQPARRRTERGRSADAFLRREKIAVVNNLKNASTLKGTLAMCMPYDRMSDESDDQKVQLAGAFYTLAAAGRGLLHR